MRVVCRWIYVVADAMIDYMPVIRCQMRLPYFSNIPEDIVTNTYHFFSDGVTPFQDAAAYLSERLESMYNSIYAGTAGAPWVNWANAEVHAYDLSAAPPRIPVITSTPITTPNGTASNIPMEAAICISFQGVVISGQPQARRRGRVFLGAFGNGAYTAGTTTTFPRPNQDFVDAIIAEFEEWLLDTEDAGIQWVVWSPTSSASVPVANGWVDNAIDTQRRRGNVPTARTLWP